MRHIPVLLAALLIAAPVRAQEPEVALAVVELRDGELKRTLVCQDADGGWIRSSRTCIERLPRGAYFDLEEPVKQLRLGLDDEGKPRASFNGRALFLAKGRKAPVRLQSCESLTHRAYMDPPAGVVLDRDALLDFELFSLAELAPVVKHLRDSKDLDLSFRGGIQGPFLKAKRVDTLYDVELEIDGVELRMVLLRRGEKKKLEPVFVAVRDLDLGDPPETFHTARFAWDGQYSHIVEYDDYALGADNPYVFDLTYLGMTVNDATCWDINHDGIAELDLNVGGDGGQYKHLAGFIDGHLQPLGPPYFWGP